MPNDTQKTRKGKRTENADLEILQNDGEDVIVTINDTQETIKVRPFKFGQLLKALKYLANIAADFASPNISEIEIINALTHHAEDMISLLCLATGKDRAFFDEISSDEGVDLALAAWRVNQFFFTERLAPKMKGLMPAAEAEKSQTGSV